jgi:membrane associated rhomboid family serine protease
VHRSSRVNGLLLVLAMVALMWLSELFDAALGGDLDQYGIVPRTDEGAAGIAAAPFLHVGFGHLISNTVPFLTMGALIALGGLARVLLVTVIVAAVSGAGTWLIASGSSVHLGASGVVFGYATYLITRGLLERKLSHLAVAIAIAVTCGAALLGGLLPQDGISWQAHLFGAAGGVVAARVLARRLPAERAPATRPAPPSLY